MKTTILTVKVYSSFRAFPLVGRQVFFQTIGSAACLANIKNGQYLPA
jgi:hypothetical protein